MRLFFLSSCLLLLISLLLACQSGEPVDFSTQVKPILNQRCIACHGGVKKQGGFSLLFEEEALAPLPSGAYGIVPGDPGASELIRRLYLEDPEERMPYHEDPLPEEEVELLTRWIEQGAQWGEHWAYQPVEAPQPPVLANDSLSRLPIDRYVKARMAGTGLDFSPEAEPEMLARRLALDLIGFPAPDSLKQPFLQNPNDQTYADLVDALLASPHFGEKWASMWLDLARYADTKGYERDPGREIWKYRDWLIRAFNQDLPYDTFLIWQLAGDLLPAPTEAQYVATAFHRNSMTNDEGGSDNEEFRTAAVLDRVNTSWEGLMSTSFACVQCHSHPYDPFRHEEYYEFAAFFNNTRDEDAFADYPLYRHYEAGQQEKLQWLGDWVGREMSEAEKEKTVHFLKTWVPARNSLTTDQYQNATLNDTKWLALRNPGSARLPEQVFEGEDRLLMRLQVREAGGILRITADSLQGPLLVEHRFSSQEKRGGWQLMEWPVKRVTGTHDVFFSYQHPRASKGRKQHLQFDWFYFRKGFVGKQAAELAKARRYFWELMEAEVTTTPVMVENPPELWRETHVFERGNRLSPGEKVEPDVPASLTAFPEGAPRNRLGLAQWMTDPAHPLTARTMANRVWEQLFGYGLVETLEDLGTQGENPSHPALLDYLAWTFVHEHDWQLKRLMKEIVQSHTYRQSSVVTAQHRALDPDNRYLSRMPRVRLSGEQIRDQALFVSGALNPEMYGKPVMPYQPEGIWNSPYTNEAWRMSTDGQQYRRAIYTYWKRTAPYPSMMTFDGVGREVCSSRRIRTNTPLQALVTLNDSVYFDLSRHLAKRVWQGPGAIEASIAQAYKLAAGVAASPEKIAVLYALYEKSLAIYQQHPEEAKQATAGWLPEARSEFAALCLVANAIINLDEVVTKG